MDCVTSEVGWNNNTLKKAQHVVTTRAEVELNDPNSVGKNYNMLEMVQHVVTTKVGNGLKFFSNVGKNYNMSGKVRHAGKQTWKQIFQPQKQVFTQILPEILNLLLFTGLIWLSDIFSTKILASGGVLKTNSKGCEKCLRLGTEESKYPRFRCRGHLIIFPGTKIIFLPFIFKNKVFLKFLTLKFWIFLPF